MDTIGNPNFVRHSEVFLASGCRGINCALERNVTAFSELFFAVRCQGGLDRG